MKLRNKKTGKIVELDHFSMHYNRPEEWGQQPCSTWNHSLAELNEEWEDYTAKEPLIKDEKIRKAVRAWAEANSLKKIQYRREELGARFNGYDYEYIQFNPWDAKNLEDYKEYTIKELCGEE